ncbi:MAG: hypothetical protein KDC83_14110 [Flavobacteriales bacterium]|nr:hypothetical protein [Flavobacteriales bacterium]
MSTKELFVTDNAIDLAIERLENMDTTEINNLFETLSHDQPYLMGFVVGLGEGLDNNEAEEDLFYLTMVIWHSIELSQNDKTIKIEEDKLKELEEKMMNRFDEVMSFTDENEEDEIAQMIATSSQPALVSYLADEFFSDEYTNLAEEKVAKMFSCMSVVAEKLAER